MKTTKDLLDMCVNVYYEQLFIWDIKKNTEVAIYAPVLAFDYIARGDY